MGSSIDIPLQALPVPKVLELEHGIALLAPLSRRGHGPGLIVLVPDFTRHSIAIDDGVPSPALKWAEESYTVIEIRQSALDREGSLEKAISALNQHEKCVPKNVIGLVGRP